MYWYSKNLKRNMNVKIYGVGGLPILVFPTQDAMSDNFENFGMIDTLDEFIKSGQIQLFCVDTIDIETWSNVYGDKEASRKLLQLYNRRSFATDSRKKFVKKIADCCRLQFGRLTFCDSFFQTPGTFRRYVVTFRRLRRKIFFRRLVKFHALRQFAYGFSEKYFAESSLH